MLSGRWTNSHRCSWITVYVSCCNAQMNFLVDTMTCTWLLYSYQLVISPAVICSPSILVIYHGETPLVNCGPPSILLHLNTIYCNHLVSAFPTSNFHLPHYTVNSLFSASRWDWQPHGYVGTKFLGCVVRRWHLKSYWFDNLGFFSEWKLAATLIIPSSWGLPTGVWSTYKQRPCWGRRSSPGADTSFALLVWP